MQTLIWIYRELNSRFPVDSRDLYEWWLVYAKKEERKINGTPEYTKEIINGFYSAAAKIHRLEVMYKGVNKYFPKQAADLIKYWKQIKVSSRRYLSLATRDEGRFGGERRTRRPKHGTDHHRVLSDKGK